VTSIKSKRFNPLSLDAVNCRVAKGLFDHLVGEHQ